MGPALSKDNFSYGAGPMGAGAGEQPVTPPPLPKLQKFQNPLTYSPIEQSTQGASFNPSSVSHNYLSRFGIAKHF